MNAPDDRDFASAQRFMLLAKQWWSTTLTDDLRQRADPYDATPTDPTLEASFGWLERHLQRAKYSGRYGLQAWIERDRESHEAALQHAAASAQSSGILSLDPKLELPAAFTAVDIHQHPGGVWSDPVAGLVYERGARSTTPLAGERHADLHYRLAALIAQRVPDARRIVDLGCGFGKSTVPLTHAMPAVEVVGIDVAAPCLTVAARDALTRADARVRFRQADARHCGEPDASAEVVTSTMLLHEMPGGDHPALFAEAFRILRPGGIMVHLDFLPDVQPCAGPFLRRLHEGHLVRNEEPYMADLMRTDLPTLLKKAGFTDVVVEPFEEAAGTLDPQHAAWRFPWALISARRPSPS